MPRVRDVLHRFRPSGAPGAATAAGVPADRATELALELEPVLALLEDTERECARIREQARVDDAGIRARDADRARAVLASGRARVEAERSAAAARARGGGGGAGDPAVRAGAGRAAGGPGPGSGADPLAQHVDRVVDAVRSLLGRDTRTDEPVAGAR